VSWPVELDETSGRGALLVGLSSEAMIQDLGAFRTGRLMETDLLPGSAVVCRADPLWRPLERDGSVLLAFEGNAIGAVNLVDFVDRAICAAGRLVTRAPSVAYGRARADQIRPLARYDLDRHVILEVLDPDGLTACAGEPADRICPPRIGTPCSDPELIRHLFPLVRSPLISDPDGALLWPLINGQVLLRERPGDPVTLQDPEDPQFVRVLRGLDPDERAIRGLYGRSGWSDPPDESSPT
jgi:hypothetical protein